MASDPYVTLGLHVSASEEDVKKAYRKLARIHHPDKGGDVTKFQEIQSAYDMIKKGDAAENEFNFDDYFSRTTSEDGWFEFKVKPQRKIYNATISLQEAFNGGVVSAQVGDIVYPAGIRSGTKIATSDGKSLVEFSVNGHEKFKRSHDDLLLDYNISAIDAMIGSKVEFTHLDGKTYNVKIPSGTQHGEIIKMSGKGMRNPEVDTVGYLYLKANLTVPKLTDEVLVNTLKTYKLHKPLIKLDTKLQK